MTPHPDHASADPSASTNAMAAALEAIRSGAATYAQASATWGIPQGTLKARIKRERAAQAKAPDPQRACNQGATAAQPTVIDLGTLHADPSNARIHDQRNKAAIAASIERHGFLGAVVVEKTTGRILAGNERTQQALAAGMLEGVVVQYDPQRQVPVIMADLDGREADRFALTDNRTAELAVWDDDLLAKVLADMGEMGDLWTAAEIKAQVAGLAPPPVQEDDTVPLPVPEIAVSKLGDVYELGPHRLVCGDATDMNARALLLGTEKPDALISDPPFGISVVPRSGMIGGAVLAQNKTYRPVANDDKAFDPTPYVDAAPTVVLFGANYFPRLLPRPGQWIVWDKCRPEGTTFSDCELAWTNREGVAVKKYAVTWNGMIREGESEAREHPTQKPVLLMRRIVEDFTSPGAMVFDPFGGSGSTMMGCAQTGRVARLIELDPGYCDVIRRRWTRWAKANNQDPGPGALE